MDKQLSKEIKELIKENNNIEIDNFRKEINELKYLVNNFINTSNCDSNNIKNSNTNIKKNIKTDKLDHINKIPINISNNITLNMINNIEYNFNINNSFSLFIYKFVHDNNIICKISKQNNLIFNDLKIINIFSIESNDEIYKILMILLIKFKYKIQNEKNTFKIDFNVYKINKIFKQIHYILEYIQNEHIE
jgi:hypothetical protein